MTLQTSTSFIPEKYRILSGSALKVLAMAIMLIDHTASFLLRSLSASHQQPWFQIRKHHLFPIPGDAGCGRAAFPYFLFPARGGLSSHP
ncbi:MAG: TraX family protein [Ruminococcus sp.]